MNLIKINSSTYYFLVLFFICGLIKEAIMIFIIVFVHEVGHALTAYINGYKVLEINIYPFGGITKIKKDINCPFLKDLLINISGILFQLILLLIFTILINYSFITYHTYNIFIKYNTLIIIFNVLPIYPLDGIEFINIILNKFTTFKKSYLLTMYISIVALTLFIYNYKFNLNNYMIITFFFFKLIELIKNKKFVFNKFLLERHLNNYKYKKVNNVVGTNLNKLKKNEFFYFWDNNKFKSEKEVLNEKFKNY